MKIKEHCGCDKGHPETKPVPILKTIKKIVKQAREKEKLSENVDKSIRRAEKTSIHRRPSKKDQQDHIMSYTYSSDINQQLRKGRTLKRNLVSQANALDANMDKIKHKSLYRVMNAHHPEVKKIEKTKIGDTYSDKGYTSTSHSHSGLMNVGDAFTGSGFARQNKFQPKHIMKITPGPKAKGLYTEPFTGGDQDEVILKRGTKMKKVNQKTRKGVTIHHFKTDE